MTKPMKYVFSILFLMLLAVPVASIAQDSPPPLAEMWVLVPKADQGKEFKKAIKKHMEFRQENGDPRDWQAYSPSLGDNLNRLAIRYCCINWADVDSYRAWSMENEKISEHFAEHVSPHVEKAEHYFESMSWENSHWSEANGPFTLFAVTEFNLKSGKAAAFDAARDKMSQIALNQGWASDDHVWAWSSTIGGKPQEAIIVPHKNWASMERDEETFFRFLARVMGSDDAAAELMESFSDAVWSTNYQVWVHSKELSMKSDD